MEQCNLTKKSAWKKTLETKAPRDNADFMQLVGALSKQLNHYNPHWPQPVTGSGFVVVYWPPVCAVLPNYEVVKFQSRSVTAPDLGSVAYCCVANHVPPFRLSLCPTSL